MWVLAILPILVDSPMLVASSWDYWFVITIGLCLWCSEDIRTDPNPRLLQTTRASWSSNRSSQTVPQLPPKNHER